MSSSIIKASVTEVNGEISCSVEETNRIRILLGLKPLRIQESDQTKDSKNLELRQEKEKGLEELRLKEKIEKAREKRLRKEKIQGHTLATAVTEEDTALLSAADWVKRSRIKELAKPEPKPLEEAVTTTINMLKPQDLKGLKVMHESEDFEIGESVILTLTDTPILENGTLNETDDILENVNIAETERRLERERNQKRLKRPIYSAYDDDEFLHVGTTKKSILSQYDEQEIKKGPQLELNTDGTVIDMKNLNNNNKNIQDIMKDVEKKKSDSLRTEINAMSDYYSKQEYASFNKKTSKKKTKKLRTRDMYDDIDDMELQANPISQIKKESPIQNDIVSSIEMNITESKNDDIHQLESTHMNSNMDINISQDHASRSSRTSATMTSSQQALVEAQKKREAYELATQIAVEKTLKHPSFQKIGNGPAGRPPSSSSSSSSSTRIDSDVLDLHVDVTSSLNRIKRIESQLKQQSTNTNHSDNNHSNANNNHDNMISTKNLPDIEISSSSSSSSSYTGEDKGAKAIIDRLNQLKKIHIKVENSDSTGMKTDNSNMNTSSSSSLEGDSAGVYISDSKALSAIVKKEKNTDEDLKFDEIDAEGRRADGTLVFTSTTEFTTRLQARLNEKARTRAEEAVKAATKLDQNKKLLENGNIREKGHKEGQWTELSGTNEKDKYNEEENEMIVEDVEEEEDEEDHDMNTSDQDKHISENEDTQLEFVHKQPLVARGMAATLALLKGSGELHTKEELAGRAKDSRNLDPSQQDYNVKLEYRDEQGRKLTQKEAFRQLSYRFHGYGPSHKKKEKRLKALEAETKAKSTRGSMDIGTMKSLIRTQEATGKAHVVVQGGLSTTSSLNNAALLNMNTKKSSSSSLSSKGTTSSKPLGSASVIPGMTSSIK